MNVILISPLSHVENLAAIEKYFKKPIEDSLEDNNRQKEDINLIDLNNNDIAVTNNQNIHTQNAHNNSISLSSPESTPEIICSKQDLDIITNNISSIIACHQKFLNELEVAITDFNDKKTLIGFIINKNTEQMLEVYPKYVNYFDIAKDHLAKCRLTNPKLRQLLEDIQMRPETKKQPLDALMIRPVQRLPSISLLINELIKRTPKDHPDQKHLLKAKENLKDILKQINENKREIDTKIKIFDVVNRVENCPIELVSATRSFLTRIDCTCKVEGYLTNRTNDRMALFLFNDCIEIARWRREFIPSSSHDSTSNYTYGSGHDTYGSSLSTHSSIHKKHTLGRSNSKKSYDRNGNDSGMNMVSSLSSKPVRPALKHYKILTLDKIFKIILVTAPSDSKNAGQSQNQNNHNTSLQDDQHHQDGQTGHDEEINRDRDGSKYNYDLLFGLELESSIDNQEFRNLNSTNSNKDKGVLSNNSASTIPMNDNLEKDEVSIGKESKSPTSGDNSSMTIGYLGERNFYDIPISITYTK